MNPSNEILQCLAGVPPGRALDLACGAGRHAIWLRNQGWDVTAVDLVPAELPGIACIQCDLESGSFHIEAAAWNLVVCWLYWQPDLLPAIAGGVRPGGLVALAGKTTGRFATSLQRYRDVFADWRELGSGEDEHKAFFIARRDVTV
jgi:SAM-dependent methyltransferase